MPLKKVIQSLKLTKFRQKGRKMLQRALPVSRVLHVIAEKDTMESRCIWGENSF